MIGNPFLGKRFRFATKPFGLLEGVCDGIVLTTRPEAIIEGPGIELKSNVEIVPWALSIRVEGAEPASCNGVWLRRLSELDEIN